MIFVIIYLVVYWLLIAELLEWFTPCSQCKLKIWFHESHDDGDEDGNQENAIKSSSMGSGMKTTVHNVRASVRAELLVPRAKHNELISQIKAFM